ncbi:MAG: cobalamin-binding protein [Spirochaetes bacterium]|nr:cobalamin-binding protein [Spirochaetota bacterium]
MRTPIPMRSDEILALVRPSVDAHSLGIASVAQLLEDCGHRVMVADGAECAWFSRPEIAPHREAIHGWLTANRITRLGFSYRLDPREGVERLARLVSELTRMRAFATKGGPLRALYFSGLPAACAMVRERVPEIEQTFTGDETPLETLVKLGVDPDRMPKELAEGTAYDEQRMGFARELIQSGSHKGIRPVDRSGYPEFGGEADTLLRRWAHGRKNGLPPIMRAHVGPYLPDRKEAVGLFLEWTKKLASGGFLDILSIGSSQLTQSHFGEDWTGLPNGGGVPLNQIDELDAVWKAARPMLVRTYAGTKGIPRLAAVHEQHLHMAWHALSLWWFCKSDGRGPHTVLENLREHEAAMKYIAGTGKPMEPNVSHHFSFRGADDVTYVVAAVIAARAAKQNGISTLILQNMLNTPKMTWGIQDLAKSRVMLRLVRELEDADFRVILQPRGGLDYFSSDLDTAKCQLAAVTALMDDIEGEDPASPPIIHVVSYSEGNDLADPQVIEESIQITRAALDSYRLEKKRGRIATIHQNPELEARERELAADCRAVLLAIEKRIAQPYRAEGLHEIMAKGFLPVPWLWECRDEFQAATKWKTRMVRGGVKVVDDAGIPLGVRERFG